MELSTNAVHLWSCPRWAAETWPIPYSACARQRGQEQEGVGADAAAGNLPWASGLSPYCAAKHDESTAESVCHHTCMV